MKRSDIDENISINTVLHSLQERIKELNCFYEMSRLASIQDYNVEDVINGLLKVIPASWQYPEDTCSRLILDEKVFLTQDFKETEFVQAEIIFIKGEPRGELEVFYKTRKPSESEGPFLKEERYLINGICERLGKLIERKENEKARIASELKLQEQKKQLENKNIALGELLSRIEQEKEQVKMDVVSNIDTFVVPIVKKIQCRCGCQDKEYFNLLERNLLDISSSLGSKLAERKIKFTPRELEICNLIKNGQNNKAIASLLNLSVDTIKTHRVNIRDKLDLNNKKINLSVYLQTL